MLHDAPPRPRLALSVGVVGHRPNRLSETARPQVITRIAEVMKLLQNAVEAVRSRHESVFSQEPATLVLLSAIAEGADRMAAEAALAQGFSLTVVLPFAREDYGRDFASPSSQREYHELLGRAKKTVVLCGAREEEASAYEAAAQTILDNADVIIAIWDSGPSAGRGGTTDLVERAAQEGLPIIHIDATGKAPTRMLWAGLAGFAFSGADLAELPAAAVDKALSEVVDRILRPPPFPAETAKLRRFLNEIWKPWNWRFAVPLLLAVLRVRKISKSDVLPEGPDLLSAQFMELMRSTSPALNRDRNSALEAAAQVYAWADALGARYANIFRSAVTFNFVAAAFAVLMAILPLMLHLQKWPFVIVEVILVALILANTWAGRSRDWHGRWLEARELAERLRAGLPLWLLGQRARAFSGGEPTWTGWYARTHFRALGLHARVFNEGTLSAIKDTIAAIVDDQCRYHAVTGDRMHKLEHRLELLGEFFFGATFCVAILYLAGVFAGWPLPDQWGDIVTALTAGLPAIGAITYGLRLVGDFEGTAKRSYRTGKALGVLGQRVRQARPSLPILRSLAKAASDTMLSDVSQWRVATETHKLAVPG